MSTETTKITLNNENAAEIAYKRSMDQVIHSATSILKLFLFMYEKGYEPKLIDNAIDECDLLKDGAKSLIEIIKEEDQDALNYKDILKVVPEHTDWIKKYLTQYKATRKLPAEIVPYVKYILGIGTSVLERRTIEGWKLEDILTKEYEEWKRLSERFNKMAERPFYVG